LGRTIILEVAIKELEDNKRKWQEIIFLFLHPPTPSHTSSWDMEQQQDRVDFSFKPILLLVGSRGIHLTGTVELNPGKL
jgi:hypothetical protein